MTSLRADDLAYELPEELIARAPVEPRDSARLMVVRPDAIEHCVVRDLPELLAPGDLVVVNDTTVLPARIVGRKRPGGARIEGLYLDMVSNGDWRVLLRSNGRLRAGMVIDLSAESRGGPKGRAGEVFTEEALTGEALTEDRLTEDAFTEDRRTENALTKEALTAEGFAEENAADAAKRSGGEAIELIERDGAAWRVRPASGAAPEAALQRIGQTPIPPYIARSRQSAGDDINDDQDRGWYQTVYAGGPARSVAAPTAGLHLTKELFERFAERGIEQTTVRLHVGAGTFKPIESERVEDHPMHAEWWEVRAEALAALSAARARGGRIVAIGTTTVRTLESLPDPLPGSRLAPRPGTPPEPHPGLAPAPDAAPLGAETRLLIQPGYSFRNVDAMMTNFHLPRSTLLALVAAHTGLERLHELYRTAIAERYRFYSYGDAMLLL